MSAELKTIRCKYLTIPSNPAKRKEAKILQFFNNGKFVYELSVDYDPENPVFTAYVEMTPFLGLKLEIVFSDGTVPVYGETDVFEPEGLYKEPYRPQIRFSVKNGWNNDPNGLVYRDGVYHMFFQYNPCATHHANMHWGHAVSTDLIHWEEKDIALYQDEWGSMFSGSAVIDEKNVSGLGFPEHPPMVLFYSTCPGWYIMGKGLRMTQRIAYSLDGGKTFIKYPETIIDCVERENRDPKVVWCEELSCYVMALYLVDDVFGLFRSDDLMHWEEFQRVPIRGDWECPNMARLRVGGTDEYLWIFFGARGWYLVGTFRDGKWVTVQEERLPYEKTHSYAGQIFSGTGDRAVMIDWVRPQVKLDDRFSQHMTVPFELTLEKDGGRYWLCKNPVSELSLIRGDEKKISLAGTECVVPAEAPGLDVTLSFSKKPQGKITVTAYGETVTIDADENAVYAAEGRSTLTSGREPFTVRILFDNVGAEVYSDGGRFVFTAGMLAEPGNRELRVCADRPLDGATLTAADLNSIWNR